MKTIEYFLIIDLEASCSDDGAVPRQEMEIIEIGAVMLDAANLKQAIKCEDGMVVSESQNNDRPDNIIVNIADEFQTFVKPVRHPQLTPFCKKLTSIRQADVDGAPLYQDAMQAMVSWVETYGKLEAMLFCSWGKYDKNQFQQDCIWNGVAYPFTDNHCNVKNLFATAPGEKKPTGLGRAIKKLGWEFSGTHHRGIDDARNIARIVQWMSHLGMQINPD